MREKILIVDDIQANTQLIAAILEQFNYETVEANSGMEALELLKDHNVDLVLLDIMMPEMDGIETCRRIKKDSQNIDLPIIFLSARNDTDIVVQGFKVGGHDYISKPFDNDILRIRIKTHIELKRSKMQLNKAHQELQQLNSTKNGFMRLMSQNLKQPVSEILKINHLLKELVDSKELAVYINKLNSSVKQLEKFSSTAVLLNDLKLNSNELDMAQVSLQRLVNEALLQQSAAISSHNLQFEMKPIASDLQVSGEKKLLVLALVKLFEAIISNYEKGTKTLIEVNQEHDRIKMILEVRGELDPESKEQLNFSRNLSLMLSKLILELHGFEISSYQSISGEGFIKIIF
ncbi:MAG: hypothetical protein CVU09_08935 [Bacteroidetes bacterium HGW-Bacteroidetes-4]|jgi:two-component system sensor histidine kinase/response regulator|nr:MAG: hypothetical protein CVU09_08935 [Bacteroidetes bacterium HGW-Bacteroidetes-4]